MVLLLCLGGSVLLAWIMVHNSLVELKIADATAFKYYSRYDINNMYLFKVSREQFDSICYELSEVNANVKCQWIFTRYGTN